MAGNVIERELTRAKTGAVDVALATAADDAEIRRLLRENPMRGKISLSLEREPNYFADTHLPGETKQTIVVREHGRVTGAGSCTIRHRFINGHARRVGYLGGLRLHREFAGRFDLIRRGYEFFHELQEAEPADFYFTSIAADNDRARRLLERGLPGMPRYEFLGEFVTILLPVRRRTTTTQTAALAPLHAEQLVKLANQHGSQFQLAPCWSEEELAALKSLGFRPENICVVRGDKRTSIAVLWDQGVFKQTVVRGFDRWLGLFRPALNLVSRFTGGTHLPPVGETVANAFVSHLATGPDGLEGSIALFNELRDLAASQGVELLTAGFDARDPRLALLRQHFRCREYRSRLYIVRWPDCGCAASELDGSLLAPEAALL